MLLGIASAMFVLLNGRILGISGILGGLLAPRMGDIGWRFAFLLGMGAAPMVFGAVMPPELLPAVRIDASEPVIALAGVLVVATGGAIADVGRPRHALRLGLHQRPWRVRAVALVAPLPGRHPKLYGCRLCHRIPSTPRSLKGPHDAIPYY